MKIANIEVSLVHHIGDDLDVANAARVSFQKESVTLDERDKKLIKYLAEHKHHSPFNHSFLSFRVKAPIFAARQLVKHRFMPWNEVSRRYVDSEPEFYFPDYWRKKADNVKQGSSDDKVVLRLYDWLDEDSNGLDTTPMEHLNLSLQMYQDLLAQGVCPEQARMVLPQNTMTEWRWSGTLNAFCDMLVLRLDKHTQLETREVAKLISKEIKKLFPVSHQALIGDLDVN